jgi:tetraacyldisaccharide 4'-kinase
MLPGFVVSVGNLTLGGTGKTPAVCMLAQWAKGKGYRVAILSRGYKGSYKQKVLAVSDGDKLLAGAEEAGDEPVMLAKKLPKIPIVVSKRRYDGGIWVHQHYDIDFFILDDGFQHRALKRDLDLVLLDGESPFGNGYLLPRGPLREPISALKRAHALVLTRCNEATAPSEKGGKVIGRGLDKPVFKSTHLPDKIVFPVENKTYGPDFISGKRVIAFAGIGRPDSFQETLKQLGAKILTFKRFGDHHRYSKKEINELRDMLEEIQGDFIITTEKDWMRLEFMRDECPNLVYLTISFAVQDKSEEFYWMIENNIKHDEKIGV